MSGNTINWNGIGAKSWLALEIMMKPSLSFKRTYKDGDDEKAWNLYVDGTIAFLNKDKPSLQAARDKLAKVPVPEKLKDARRKFLKITQT